MAGEAHRRREAQLGDVAVQCADIGIRRGFADDQERGLGVGVGAGHGESAATVLSRPLLGETRPMARPTGATIGRAEPRAAPRPSRFDDVGIEGSRRGDDGRGGEAGRGQVRLVVFRVGDRQGGPRCEQTQVALGPQLPQGQVVVPGRHELRRGDVVVVDHQGLGPGGQPRCHRRGGGELVDDDVARLRQLGVE